MRNTHKIVCVFCLFILMSLLNPAESSGQAVPPVSQEVESQTPDVMILVFPTSADTARVGLSYHQRVPHDRVKKEISQLASNGWVIGSDLDIDDRSIRPGAPIVTGAHFSVARAPQVVNNAPMLHPYLQAFQGWNQVEILFSLADLNPYNGVEKFESPALSVRRIPEDNVYHYEAAIRDHKGALPDFREKQTAEIGTLTTGQPASSGAPKSLPVPLLPLMLMLLGGGLLAGLGIYSFLTRRQSETTSLRNTRL